ncbi:hypothetical protein Tco_0791605 [Tanacetum coccineum]
MSISTEQEGFRKDTTESVCSGHFKKPSASRTGGSIICMMEELAKVGQTFGRTTWMAFYKICISNHWDTRRGSCGSMNCLSLNIQGLAQKALKVMGLGRIASNTSFDKPDCFLCHLNLDYPITFLPELQLILNVSFPRKELKKAAMSGLWMTNPQDLLASSGVYTYVHLKFLSNRLVVVLGDIVNEVQSAFIKDRQILNDPFILNEVLQWFMESLHLSFQRVVDAGLFKGIKLNSSTTISHMFYADDVVFVGQWCEGNITTLTHVLECFYRASGLRINMAKSKIMGTLVAKDTVNNAAVKLGCLILNTPFTYLGTKVGSSMTRYDAWEEVINKVCSRLSKWKMKCLSIGGRLTLIKSVLTAIPIFHLSIYKAPLAVLRKLESIRCHFFHGHDHNNTQACWIKWSKILAPKDKGGLGVGWLAIDEMSHSWIIVMRQMSCDATRMAVSIEGVNCRVTVVEVLGKVYALYESAVDENREEKFNTHYIPCGLQRIVIQ